MCDSQIRIGACLMFSTNYVHCCINRSQLSYGLTGLALIRADGAQPSLHLDEYVFVPYIYGLVALLESTIKASSSQYFNMHNISLLE